MVPPHVSPRSTVMRHCPLEQGEYWQGRPDGHLQYCCKFVRIGSRTAKKNDDCLQTTSFLQTCPGYPLVAFEVRCGMAHPRVSSAEYTRLQPFRSCPRHRSAGMRALVVKH